MIHNISPAFKISLIYLIFSLVWIFTSDSIVASISENKETLIFLQTIKGWFFVTATSLLIFLLTRKYLKVEKALQSILEEKQQTLKNIIENSPVPTVVLDETGDCLIINKIWLKLTGYEFEEINTLEKWTQRAYPNEAKIKEKSIQKLFSNQNIDDNGEFTIRTKEGKEITWHFYSSLLNARNGKKRLIGTAIDITELKRKNSLIIQQSKMAALGEMLENIAHQWRQPLSNISTISTGIELQQDYEQLNLEELGQSMKTINNNVQYLSNTINDFRNFFDKNKTKKYFSADGLIGKVIDLINPRIQEHNITIIHSIEENIKIRSYENELIQVIINIFNNAIDVLKEKPTKPLIFIEVRKKEKDLVIEIKDSGGGMQENVLTRVFEPYFTTKHKSQGTGIGLYMCEEIISKHLMGSIEAFNTNFKYENQEYQGAKFKITLPLKV